MHFYAILISNTLDEIVGYRFYKDKDKYDSILSIPKINLKKGIYRVDDIRNTIDNNIMIDKNSIYPNSYPSNIIFIAHSGYGEKAYFNNLKYLDNDSLVEFFYDGIKYIYKIDNYYYVSKTGKVKIDYDITKKTITLITCSSNNKQVVYIGYLIDEIEY